MNEQNNIFSEEDHLPGDASGLTGISKANPFRAPDGYFEELPRFIRKRCPLIFPDQSNSWGFFADYRAPLMVAVVMVAFAIALFILVVNPWRAATGNPDEIAGYVLEKAQSGYFFHDIDDSVIYYLAPEESMISSFMLRNTECSTEEVITYLVDENIDMETISQL